jgi:hypothetical protein
MIKKSSQELINLNVAMLTLTGNAAFHGPCSVSHGEMANFYLQPGLTFIFLALIYKSHNVVCHPFIPIFVGVRSCCETFLNK